MREAEPVAAASRCPALANLSSCVTAYGAAGPIGLAATRFMSASLFARQS